MVGINLSGAQFKLASQLDRIVADRLQHYSIAPERIELELIESVLIEIVQRHSESLDRLRKSGVRLAVQKFGSGYSSLDYLRRLPVDSIKIAQEFVRDIAGGGPDATITRIAILLGRALGLRVLAEGVETAEQFAKLKLWGCQEVQGYLFARPMPAEQFAAVLAERAVDTNLVD